MSRHAAPEPSEPKKKSKLVTVLVIVGMYVVISGILLGLRALFWNGVEGSSTDHALIVLGMGIGFVWGNRSVWLWQVRHGN